MVESANKSRALAIRIVERQKFIARAAEFARSVTAERGVRLKEEIHDNYTRVEAEIDDFDNFSFYSDGHYSMFGGQLVRIWRNIYQPKGPHNLMLEVEWWDMKEFKLKHFNPHYYWQQELRHLMRARTIALARVKREAHTRQRREIQKAEREAELQRVERHLQAEAQRLLLV